MAQKNLEKKVDIFAYMKETARKVDSYTLEYVQGFGEVVKHLPTLRCGMKRGKPKLLPTLGRLAFEAVGGKNWEEIVPVLSAFELGTSSCYVIDDILDNQEVREGDSSTVRKYGLNKAIIAGLIQYTLSNEILLNSELEGKDKEDVCRLWNETLKTIYLGQDENENTGDFSENSYLERCYFIAGVAAEKISEICSIFGKSSESDKDALKNFGRNYGIACQIRNDLMDLIPQEVIGSRSQSLSRNSYEDIRKGILTYPIVYAFNNGCGEKVRSAIGEGDFSRLTELLVESGAMNATADLIEKYRDNAISYVESLKGSNARDNLFALAKLLGNSKKYIGGILEKITA